MAKSKKSPDKVNTIVATDYAQTVSAIKLHIQQAQIKAVLSANKELIKLYWSIGKIIAEKQRTSGWGSSTIEKLAHDLQSTFPGLQGFSRTNVFRMRAFYASYEKIPQAVGQIDELPIFNIPWGHNTVLLEQVKDNDQRFWYAQRAIENGWSRSMLETWIKSDLYSREGKAVTNFKHTLPAPHSDIAQQSLKDPYIFDFLTLQEQHLEHDLEQGLVNNVQKLLLEMGKGFALVGRQYHLEVSNKDYYVDLLFYHYKLRCFVVVELKAREFDPRDAGQINFYLSAIDDLLRSASDEPTIGLLLCKTKDNFTVEYALRNIKSPIGVAGYETELMKKLPKNLKSSLPTIEEFEAELDKKKASVAEKKEKGS